MKCLTHNPTCVFTVGIPSCGAAVLQVGMFGDVDLYQRQLDRIAGVLDGDDEDAMADLVQGEW